MWVLIIKVKELLGFFDKWNQNNINEFGNFVVGFLFFEFRKIGDQVIKDFLQVLKDVDLDLDQVSELIVGLEILVQGIVCFSLLF